jgi:hypothetical protein
LAFTLRLCVSARANPNFLRTELGFIDFPNPKTKLSEKQTRFKRLVQRKSTALWMAVATACHEPVCTKAANIAKDNRLTSPPPETPAFAVLAIFA